MIERDRGRERERENARDRQGRNAQRTNFNKRRRQLLFAGVKQ